ncbi:MAG: hypothetical protein ACNA71_07670 [Kiritimatiellia bacterium]
MDKDTCKRKAWIWIYCVSFMLAGVSCTSEKIPPEGLLTQVPAELKGAQLLYHRPDGLYFTTLGQDNIRKIHPHGYYGRWAPDGHAFAYIAQNEIFWHSLKTDVSLALAKANNVRAIAFHPDGKQIFFTDGTAIRAVEIETHQIRTVVSGPECFEIDVAPDASFLAATVRRRGYRVMRFSLPSGQWTDFGRGCSASVSANNEWITVNAGDHLTLTLHDSGTGKATKTIPAPAAHPLDNQKWSNHREWVAGIVEHPAQDIIIQFVPDGRVWRITDVGDADRPDLFIHFED